MSTRTLLTLARLCLYVWVGTFIGAVFEFRGWMRWFAFLARPLMRLARISELAAAAFITAFVSNSAANAMVAGARAEGEISRRELIVCGIANAFPAKVSHFMRILFPLIGTIGLPGALYAGIQFLTGAVRTALVWLIGGAPRAKDGDGGVGSVDASSERVDLLRRSGPLSWPKTLVKASKRASRILGRVCLISAPMYMIVSFLAAFGFFDTWKSAMPSAISGVLPPEVMTVIVARLGGILSAAAAAVELRTSGALNDIQITSAFLIGNMFTNPIRAVRRNLPASLGIFGQDGFVIVLVVQLFRFIAALIAVGALLAIAAGRG